MKVIFLGTSGSMPTPERSSSSVAVKMGRDVVILDCGEGTQRQMVAAHIGFSRVKLIFVTHLHGDHVLGVPGLLQSMTLQRREEPSKSAVQGGLTHSCKESPTLWVALVSLSPYMRYVNQASYSRRRVLQSNPVGPTIARGMVLRNSRETEAWEVPR